MVMALIGEEATEWGDIRKVLRKDDFIQRVVNYNPESVTTQQVFLSHLLLCRISLTQTQLFV